MPLDFILTGWRELNIFFFLNGQCQNVLLRSRERFCLHSISPSCHGFLHFVPSLFSPEKMSGDLFKEQPTDKERHGPSLLSSVLIFGSTAGRRRNSEVLWFSPLNKWEQAIPPFYEASCFWVMGCLGLRGRSSLLHALVNWTQKPRRSNTKGSTSRRECVA